MSPRLKPVGRRSAPGSPGRTRKRTARGSRATVTAPVDLDAQDSTAAGRRLSVRTLVVVALLVVIGAMFVPSVNVGIRQFQQIVALEQDNEVTAEEVADLEKQQDRLEDPDYLAQRAREDQQYVKSGEKAYVVVDENPDETAESEAVTTSVRSEPWYTQLVDSLTNVGYATKETSTP